MAALIQERVLRHLEEVARIELDDDTYYVIWTAAPVDYNKSLLGKACRLTAPVPPPGSVCYFRYCSSLAT